MRECQDCRIKIKDEHISCPLCGNKTIAAEHSEDYIFTSLNHKKYKEVNYNNRKYITYALFLSFILAIILSIVLKSYNVLYVSALGLLFIRFTIISYIYYPSNSYGILSRTAFYICFSVFMLSIRFNYAAYALGYTVPIIAIISMFILIAMSYVDKRLNDYIYQLCVWAIFSMLLLPINAILIFYLIPSIISLICGVILLAVLLIKYRAELKEAFLKRFYI